MKERNKMGKSKNNSVLFMGLASQMIATILLFSFLGFWLDKKFEMEQKYLTAAFSLLGVFASLYMLFKQLPKE